MAGSGESQRSESDAEPPEVGEISLVQRSVIERVHGTRVAFAGSGTTWVSAGRHGFTLWDGQTPVTIVQHVFVDRLHFDESANRLYVSPRIYDLDSQSLVEAPALEAALTAGLDSPSLGHFSIDAAAFSPDGRQLIVHASYRPPSGLAFQGMSGPVPGDRLLLLDGATYELLEVLLEGRTERIRTVAVNDHFIAAGGREIHVWERSQAGEVTQLSGHEYALTDLQFDSSGRFLASTGSDGRVCLWRTDTWSQVGCWVAHEGDALAVAFHPTRPVLATGGQDGLVIIWSVTRAGELLTSLDLPGRVVGLAFDGPGHRLMAVCHGRTARNAHLFDVIEQASGR